MKKAILKLLTFVQVASLACSMLAFTPASAANTSGVWLAGDFHTHTWLSDGRYTAAEVAANAKKYGLDWYSATDHGGSSTGANTISGLAKDSSAQFTQAQIDAATGTTGTITTMPRWASINGIGEDYINNNRNTYGSSLLQFSGFEWNVPTHEHASVGIVGNSADVKKNLAIFDYTFDGTKETQNTTIDWLKGINRALDGKIEGSGASVLTNNSHPGAIEGAKYLQQNYPLTSYLLINHPSRNLAYSAADLKELNDAAATVAFGMELLPGHQASDFRGGESYMNVTDPVLKKTVNINSTTYVVDASIKSSTVADKLNAYLNYYTTSDISVTKITQEQKDQYIANKTSSVSDIKAYMLSSLMTNIPKQRTYGGADYMLAKIGGVYDTMLSEGRKFWLFGNSDFHMDTERANQLSAQGATVEPDFWPGQYSKNYTFCADKSYQSILDGMRSGNSFAVLGDLINALDYKMTNNDASATMGQTLTTVSGKSTVVTIRFKSPSTNANDKTPTVDHIDLIGGQVNGIPAQKMQVPDDSHAISNFIDNKQYLTSAYQNDDVSATTKVIRTFNKSEFKLDSDGYYSLTFTLPSTDKDMFYRLRGTNNAIGSANVDANGNPTIDTPVESLVGGNTTDKAFDDLWFYSNPIFVNKQVNGVSISGSIKDASGNPIANKTVELHSTTMTTTTDANGSFTLSNVEYGMHTIYVKDTDGKELGEMTFMLQSGTKTEFADGDVWVAPGVTKIQLDFKMSGSTMSISNIKELAWAVVNNPKTSVPMATAPIIFIVASIAVAVMKIYSNKTKAKRCN